MTDLADALGTDETESLELKRDLSSTDSVRKAICALANDLAGRGGGTLVIGVQNDGRPFPIDVGDQMLRNVANLRDDGKLLPRPTIAVETGLWRGSQVVVVRVRPCEHPPMRLDGVTWVRVGTSSRRAHAGEEAALVERRRAFDLPVDQRPVPDATLGDLDLELFRSTYLPAAVSPDVLDENRREVVEQLASLRLARSDGTPTVAGLLVLGLDPTGFLSGAYTQFVRYEGSDEDSSIADEAELRGNLVDQLRDLDLRIPGHIRHRSVQEGLRELEAADYPIAALREAIVNALVHRSYESRAPVRVLWLANRVEVVNPGGPYGVVTAQNFDAINDYRNPTIAEAAKNLGYMNRFGRGIARIRLALERNGSPPPEFGIEALHWSVIIRARP